MYFDLQNPNLIVPEIDDVFTVQSGEESYKLITKEAIENSCEGCAFEEYCSGEYNRTPFNCNDKERPDKKNVVFVLE